jgi:hypothetical protein
MKLLFITCSFLMVYKTLWPTKARLVFFDKEMTTAKFIGQVIIEKYDTSGLCTFRSLEFKDTIKTAQSHRLFDRFWYDGLGMEEFWTGKCPEIKDTVLIVVDSTYRISLCAKLTGENYRFWDAHPSISVAFFKFKPPAKKLTKPDNEGEGYCWDGCFLHKDSIDFYKK